MQYYYEIDIKSADVVVSTMAINKNIPARVMIQRISDNTFSHAYDGSVLTTKFINNNRREVNEKAALYVNGSPATLNIDYTLIRK
jgi:predicted GTPase